MVEKIASFSPKLNLPPKDGAISPPQKLGGQLNSSTPSPSRAPKQGGGFAKPTYQQGNIGSMRKSKNVDSELQNRLEQQREEEAAQSAQNFNQTEQQKKLAQKTPEEQEEDTIQESIAGVRAQSRKAVTFGRLALTFTNIGVNLTTNFISLVTIIGPIVGILCFMVAGFFAMRTSWEINKIKKLHKSIPPKRVALEIRKQILNTKNIVITSCLGCASTAVAGILVMFLAFIPVVIIYKMIGAVGNVPTAAVKAVTGLINAASNAEKKQSQQ